MTSDDRVQRPDPWLTLYEAASYLRYTVAGIRTLVARGELHVDGRGRNRMAMFRRSTLDAFLRERAEEGGQK